MRFINVNLLFLLDYIEIVVVFDWLFGVVILLVVVGVVVEVGFVVSVVLLDCVVWRFFGRGMVGLFEVVVETVKMVYWM